MMPGISRGKPPMGGTSAESLTQSSDFTDGTIGHEEHQAKTAGRNEYEKSGGARRYSRLAGMGIKENRKRSQRHRPKEIAHQALPDECVALMTWKMKSAKVADEEHISKNESNARTKQERKQTLSPLILS